MHWVAVLDHLKKFYYVKSAYRLKRKGLILMINNDPYWAKTEFRLCFDDKWWTVGDIWVRSSALDTARSSEQWGIRGVELCTYYRPNFCGEFMGRGYRESLTLQTLHLLSSTSHQSSVFKMMTFCIFLKFFPGKLHWYGFLVFILRCFPLVIAFTLCRDV